MSSLDALTQRVAINPTRKLSKGQITKYVAMDNLKTWERRVTGVIEREFKGGSKFRNGDTLLARITPCLENGKTAYVDFLDDGEVAHGSTEFIVLSGKDGVSDNLFVYYLSRSPEFRSFAIQSMEGTSGRQRVPTTALDKFEFQFPPLKDQREIALILGSLDDKIELNREMNETLEAMVRALFKCWFVDFEPVRMKATGLNPSAPVNEGGLGLDPAIAALFPDSFQDSELGEIPKGWEVKPLDEIAEFLNGLAMQKHPAEQTDEGALPVIKIAQMRSGSTESASYASPTFADKYLVRDGDLLFSWSGSLLVDFWTLGHGALNQHLFKVTSDTYPIAFVYFWLLEHLPWFQHIAASKATTMGHIQRHHLNEAKVVVPNESFIAATIPTVARLVERKIANSLESRTLATMRDTLLPKLISGETVIQGKG